MFFSTSLDQFLGRMSIDSAWVIMGLKPLINNVYEDSNGTWKTSDEAPDKVDLDEVKREIIGAFNILSDKNRAQKMKQLLFVKQAIDFISEPKFLMELIARHVAAHTTATLAGKDLKEKDVCLPKQKPKKEDKARSNFVFECGCVIEDTATAAKWKKHIDHLVEAGMLVAVKRELLIAGATYFAVLKSNGKARAIFNGRQLNKLIGAAPPINTPTVQEILKEMNELPDGSKKAIFTADIRHWFHQIPLAEHVSRFFGIRLGLQHYRWASLPMGTSWSPFIAQSFSWYMLLNAFSVVEKDWPFRINKEELLKQPPRWLELKGGGFITVYLDNIIAVGNEGMIREMFGKIAPLSQEEMDSNCNRVPLFKEMFNVEIKEAFFRSSEEWQTSPISVLGVEVRRPLVDGDKGRFRLQWRAVQTKIDTWKERWEALNKQAKVSHRDVARICGRLLWMQSLSLRPLSRIHDVIKVLRHNAKCKGSASWDACFVLGEEFQQLLIPHVESMLKNDWIDRVKVSVKRRTQLWVASDACDDGWGWVQLFSDGSFNNPRMGTYEKAAKDWHIFIKEYLVAKLAIQQLIEARPESERFNLQICIAIDNSAAAQVIRNMYTANEFLQSHVEALNELVAKYDVDIRVINVRSKDNCADAPSRGKSVDAEIAKTTVEVMSEGMKGKLANEYVFSDAPRWGRDRKELEFAEDGVSTFAEAVERLQNDPLVEKWSEEDDKDEEMEFQLPLLAESF